VLVVVLPNIEALRSSGFTYPTRLPEVVDVTSHPFRAVTGVAEKGLSQPCGLQGETAIVLRNELSLTMYPMVSAVAVSLTDVRLSVVVDLAIMRGRRHRLTTSVSLCRYFVSPSFTAANPEGKLAEQGRETMMKRGMAWGRKYAVLAHERGHVRPRRAYTGISAVLEVHDIACVRPIRMLHASYWRLQAAGDQQKEIC
jgi:hypothetical protein